MTYQDRPEGFVHISFKRDVMKAREILTDLLKMAATLLHENTKQPGNQKDSQRLRMEKRLEELFRILDQVESNLKLALQWHTQSAESKKHVTLPLANKKTDEYNMMHGQSKIQPIPLQLYMNVVKHQIQAAQDLHELLADSEGKLTRTSTSQSSSSTAIPAASKNTPS